MELPWQIGEILGSLRAAGYQAYAVGGCVRDMLRGAAPHDWDLCTSALPGEVERLFLGRFAAAHTGAAHGTLTLAAEGLPVEVTTFRADGPYTDHRRPASVRLGASLAEDLARRDFTINAMALGPEGAVIDLFGGRRDLSAGLVRCVGNPEDRFAEDALRILRALRFAAALDFAMEPATQAAARAQKGALRFVAAERVAAELDRLLTGPGAGRVLAGCGDILAVALPEIADVLCGPPCPALAGRTPWEFVAETIGAAAPVPQVRWALLLGGLGRKKEGAAGEQGPAPEGESRAERAGAGAEQALRRLKVKRSFGTQAAALVRCCCMPLPTDETGVRRFLAHWGLATALWRMEAERARLAALAGGPGARCRRQGLERFEELVKEQLAAGACLGPADLAVKGKELLEAGLYRPGPEMGRALKELLEQVLEGALPNEKTALLAWAAEHKK